MRKNLTSAVLILLLAISAIYGGCGRADTVQVLTDMLERNAGTIADISFLCTTKDGERSYREEYAISFPDEVRYRFYEYGRGEMRLTRYTAQSGGRVVKARVTGQTPGISIQAELLENIPPLRGTGYYLSFYHLPGNADYYHSLISLIQGGTLFCSSQENLEGREAIHLRSSEGLQPVTDLWLDATNGLPLRKTIQLPPNRTISFSFQYLAINQGGALEPFPQSAPEIAALFGTEDLSVQFSTRDGGCRPLEAEEAPGPTGFAPLLPEMEGWERVYAFSRDPAAYGLNPTEQSLSFPEGFRELYLVYRHGTRQLEIKQVPVIKEFAYYTTGLGTLSEAYLVQRQSLGAETGNAYCITALDCQEMHMVAGGVEITVTGDVSRREMESLARQLQSLAADNR